MFLFAVFAKRESHVFNWGNPLLQLMLLISLLMIHPHLSFLMDYRWLENLFILRTQLKLPVDVHQSSGQRETEKFFNLVEYKIYSVIQPNFLPYYVAVLEEVSCADCVSEGQKRKRTSTMPICVAEKSWEY